jgi:hypothetical protein
LKLPGLGITAGFGDVGKGGLWWSTKELERTICALEGGTNTAFSLIFGRGGITTDFSLVAFFGELKVSNLKGNNITYTASETKAERNIVVLITCLDPP